MKRSRWYRLATLVGALLLLLDVLAFGGVMSRADVGPSLRQQARLQAPMMHTYGVLGMALIDKAAPWLKPAATALADAAWGDAYGAIEKSPELATDLLWSQSRGVVRALLRLSSWGAPLLLLAALLGWWRQPKPVHIVGPGMRRR